MKISVDGVGVGGCVCVCVCVCVFFCPFFVVVVDNFDIDTTGARSVVDSWSSTRPRTQSQRHYSHMKSPSTSSIDSFVSSPKYSHRLVSFVAASAGVRPKTAMFPIG